MPRRTESGHVRYLSMKRPLNEIPTLWIVIYTNSTKIKKNHKSSPAWNTSLLADVTVRKVLWRNLTTFCGFFSRVPLIWNVEKAQEAAITAHNESKQRVRNA